MSSHDVTIFHLGNGTDIPSDEKGYTEAGFRTLCERKGVKNVWGKSLTALKSELYNHPFFFEYGGFITLPMERI